MGQTYEGFLGEIEIGGSELETEVGERVEFLGVLGLR